MKEEEAKKRKAAAEEEGILEANEDGSFDTKDGPSTSATGVFSATRILPTPPVVEKSKKLAHLIGVILFLSRAHSYSADSHCSQTLVIDSYNVTDYYRISVLIISRKSL